MFLLPLTGLSQTKDLPPYKPDGQFFILPFDSLPQVVIPEITVFPQPKDRTPRAMRQYTLLEFRVKKVYPIAKLAGIKIAEYNRVYLSFNTERERKDYVKNIEKELFATYEKEIRSMSIGQGRILIKLIDRETGKSSYNIIKEFKGGFSAFFWQGIAHLFGNNLKSEYDAANEDQMIEYIIWQIEMGMI
jgi:hypothetical protein